MNTYRVKFAVNGRRTETVVKANTVSDAKKIVQAQYAGADVRFISVERD